MRQVVDHQSRRELEGHLSLIQAFLKMDQGESPQSKQLIRALLPMVVAEVQHKGAKTPLAPLARLAIAPAVEVCIGPCSQKPVAFGEGVKYYGHLNADLPKEPSLFDRNPSEIPTGARYEEGALMIPVPRPDVESLVAAEIGLLQQKGGGGRRLKVWLTSDDFIVLPSTEERNWVFSTIPVSWLEDWKSAGGSEVWLRVENLNLDGRPSTQRVNVVAVRFHTWSS